MKKPSAPTILLADRLHIAERNFGSFMRFLASHGIQVRHAPDPPLPIDAFGTYDPAHELIRAEMAGLARLSGQELFGLSLDGINLYRCARAELFSKLACRPELLGADFGKDPAEGFALAWRHAPDEVLTHIAVARIWLRHWASVLPQHRGLAYAAVFSGSLIYARSFIETMKCRPGRLFVLESFFSGAHYYCEERYGPIANLSDIALDTVYRSLPGPKDALRRARRATRLVRELAQWRSKNVKPAPPIGERLFPEGRTMLVIGQVLNDFSLLEANEGAGIASLREYHRVITHVLRHSRLNVVFKAHPWERQKHNLRGPVTAEFIAAQFRGEQRVKVIEDAPMADLLAQSSLVYTISSQGGIEAAAAGFRPVQSGNAFWGRRGFSHDIAGGDLAGLGRVLDDPDGWTLDLRGFEQFQDWLGRCVDHWLVPEDAVDPPRLRDLFHEVRVAGRPAGQKAAG